MAAHLSVVIVMVSVVLSTPGAGSAAVDQGGRPFCFHACFDQCVLRDEFWFCQFSCYHRCAATGSRAVQAPDRDCEHSCARSMCGQLRPGSKMMAACRDTCRKSYAVAECRSSAGAAA
ncbi:unnamed protein product [Miscanthus lutarioriparius]|uniref:Uncharacterized protein n=1 Tax=Miscanthus lutarioriparius TaxID=422564 RepID=A0A811NVT9_9POAL|nr:unnamed protein product [Miscanthus lutarioriparius]